MTTDQLSIVNDFIEQAGYPTYRSTYLPSVHQPGPILIEYYWPQMISPSGDSLNYKQVIMPDGTIR